jgi:hypothetical protein
MTLKFLALQGAPYIYDISRLRVKINIQNENFLHLSSQFHHIQSEREVLFNIYRQISKHKKLKDNLFQTGFKLGFNCNMLAIANLNELY